METPIETTSVQKEWLKNSTVHETIIRYGRETPYTAARFTIPKFGMLDENVKYGYKVDELKWDIRLTKLTDTIMIELRTEESLGNISYVVVYSKENNFSKVINMKETENFLYKIRVPFSKIVNVAENELFTNEGTLELQFRFHFRENKKIFHHLCESVSYSAGCMDGVSRNMLSVGDEQHFYKNYALILYDGELVKVDKAVVAARTKILGGSLEQKDEKKMSFGLEKFKKKYVRRVVTYMYTGEISSPRRKTMKNYYDLAMELKFRSLARRTASFLMECPQHTKLNSLKVKDT